MKKPLILILAFVLLAVPSLCIKIDGKFWDWAKINAFYNCPVRPLEKGRSGFDMESVKVALGRKDLYIYIDGRSVTGPKQDSGWGAKKTSVRISFKSSQSPLNRVRIAAYPDKPGQIRIACPNAASKVFGSKTDRYWMIAKYGKKYAFEIKIPFFVSSQGIHVGVKGGPLIRIPENVGASRNKLSDVLINTVDMKTHRLVDTVEFTIKKGNI
jgi:hypothetical protein